MKIVYLAIAAGFFFASLWISMVSNRSYYNKLDACEKEKYD